MFSTAVVNWDQQRCWTWISGVNDGMGLWNWHFWPVHNWEPLSSQRLMSTLAAFILTVVPGTHSDILDISKAWTALILHTRGSPGNEDWRTRREYNIKQNRPGDRKVRTQWSEVPVRSCCFSQTWQEWRELIYRLQHVCHDAHFCNTSSLFVFQ